MSDELYNKIYDAMCLALEQLEDIACPVENTDAWDVYQKLDRAAGLLYAWYNHID